MACPVTDESQRKYPLKRPNGWTPKMTRYTLKLPDDVKELAVAYIGIQIRGSRNGESNDWRSASETTAAQVEDWIEQDIYKPVIVDRFEVLSGRDIPGSLVWACYWVSKGDAERGIKQLNLKNIYHALDPEVKPNIGVWHELVTPDINYFETNYSGVDYQPGLANLKGSTQETHGLTGYWGAARDRIRASAYDNFEGSSDPAPPNFEVNSQGACLKGKNKSTIAHIRSGQFWENCSEEEREAYEKKLEPHLRNGLLDIERRPKELGDFGLRFVRNFHPRGQSQEHVRRETCAAGFSRSLADLEAWAKDCPSHHKIFGGILHHVNTFGKEYKVRTWHEVCVLKPGEASWEYINCVPNTGTLAFQASTVIAL